MRPLPEHGMITAIGILEIEKSDNSAAERLVALGNHDEGKDDPRVRQI